MRNSLVQKPKGLNIKRKWLRANDIADEYPIGLSTVWDWAKKGKLTPIKVSARVTVFLLKEVDNLFKYDIRKIKKVAVDNKKVRRRRKAKVFKSFTPIVRRRAEELDKKMVDKFICKREKELVTEKNNTRHHTKKRIKLPPAKEGTMGVNKKMNKGRI